MPQRWEKVGVEHPSPDCIHWTKQVLGRLATKYGIKPSKVAYSIEGGIFVAYISDDGATVLNLEIDNDIDVIAVLSRGNKVIGSVVIENENEKEIIDAFLS